MLPAGTRLGPYEIAALIGAGGMGQVYKARDTRLDRTVALKVLAADVAADPVFRERFEREARAVSGLDHAHICALYDVGSDRGTDFLVMQFLDGETLAARLARGPLPPAEAMRYGSQIASALTAAHRRGIVHRDLKPANVMLTKGGVKLLDFGIASLGPVERAAPGPTRTNPLTGQGVLLGTLQYMAPEQLEGKEADARSDIWALGAVLYEMLTGRPAFSGGSPASVIGAILHSVPSPVSDSQALTPPAVDRVVAKCLNKDPDERWQSAHDVGDELRWIAGSAPEAAAAALPPPAAPAAGWSKRALAAALVVALASIGFAAWTWRGTRQAPDGVYRLGLPLPAGADIEKGIALSPDGRWLAFAGAQAGSHEPVLWIRAMDSFDGRPIAGTEGTQLPFWSPDSRHVGFFAAGKLRRVAVSGGAPQDLADVSSGRGGSWSRDNVIVFAPGFATSLMRVSADGGEAKPLTTLKPSEATHRWPHFLPDGRHFLYLVRGGTGLLNSSGSPEILVGSLDGGEPTKLLVADSSVVYTPPGLLLFAQSGMLMAQPFSAPERRLTGEAFMVSDKVLRIGDSGPTGLGVFSAGAGLLVYSADETVLNELGWFDRGGKRLGTYGSPADYTEMWLSPDQSEAVLSRSGDLWTVNFARGTSSRFTFEPTSEFSPVWSPDGKWIVYSSDGALTARLATGGAPHPLLKVPDAEIFPADWSRDGRHILFERVDRKREGDLWAMPAPVLRPDGTLEPAGKPFPVLTSSFIEAHPQFSPDGKWIAYASNESGRAEVYIQSFPAGQGKWTVSTDGGDQPAWRRDGRELYYISADKRLIAVDVRTTPTVQIGAPVTLFQTTVPTTGLEDSRNNYVPSADGQRFLVSSLPALSSAKPLRVVLNWEARGVQ